MPPSWREGVSSTAKAWGQGQLPLLGSLPPLSPPPSPPPSPSRCQHPGDGREQLTITMSSLFEAKRSVT